MGHREALHRKYNRVLRTMEASTVVITRALKLRSRQDWSFPTATQCHCCAIERTAAVRGPEGLEARKSLVCTCVILPGLTARLPVSTGQRCLSALAAWKPVTARVMSQPQAGAPTESNPYSPTKSSGKVFLLSGPMDNASMSFSASRYNEIGIIISVA